MLCYVPGFHTWENPNLLRIGRLQKLWLDDLGRRDGQTLQGGTQCQHANNSAKIWTNSTISTYFESICLQAEGETHHP